MDTSIFWFRRDLRLEDNAGLFHALSENENVLPVFIFDADILDRLTDKYDRRVDFIYGAITSLNAQLNKIGSSLQVYVGNPLTVFKKICAEYTITSVYANHDYEPYAITRDNQIKSFLSEKNIAFKTYKDQCIFEKSEVVKDDGLPYTVFTPYAVKWKKKLNDFYIKPYTTHLHFNSFKKIVSSKIPSLKDIGFLKTDLLFNSPLLDEATISKYTEQRDFPAIKGTSRLSVHLRFGTVSIRKLVQVAAKLNQTWLNELIWRDFYMMILSHFPYVTDGAFKPKYNFIEWHNNENEFKAWCKGETGYPIVDAGMRELNETGFMHNRVRMITASFLVKNLLIDWRWGEAYFAQKLLDFDLSANNGGWQWAASCGCDAAPYFRIFNPYEQTKKFDPKLIYIKKWIPDYDELSYIKPIVDYKMSRERALAVYKKTLGN